MGVSVVILLSIVFMVSAFNQRRCLYFAKKCVDHCPRHMHPYHMRCDGLSRSQRTCANPNRFIIGYTCGWSRCDCNGDLLLDEDSGMCMDFGDCPVQGLRKRNRSGKRKQGKKWRVPAVRPQDLIDSRRENID